MSTIVAISLGVIGLGVLEQDGWLKPFRLRLEQIQMLVRDNTIVPDTPSVRANSGLGLALIAIQSVARKPSTTMKIDEYNEALALGLLGRIDEIRATMKDREELTILGNAALLGLLWGEHFESVRELVRNQSHSEWLKPAINSAYLSSKQHGFEDSAKFLLNNFENLIESALSHRDLITRYETKMRMNRLVGRNWRRFFEKALDQQSDDSPDFKSAQLMVRNILESQGGQPFNAETVKESLGNLVSHGEFSQFEPIVAWINCRYDNPKSAVLDGENLASLSMDEFELKFLVDLEKDTKEAVLLVNKMNVNQLEKAQEFFAVYCYENQVRDESIVEMCSKISNPRYRLALLCATVQPFPMDGGSDGKE